MSYTKFATEAGPEGRQEVAEQIVGRLARRYGTAAVLLHQVGAARLGLGPTDRQCFDLLLERGPMIGSDLAAITGLTSGAITGAVARLERAGYLRRQPDPNDGRKQILFLVPERVQEIQDVFEPIREDLAAMLERFDAHQLAAIAEFLAHGTDLGYRHAALLRVQTHPGVNAAMRDPRNQTKERGPR